MNITNKQTNFLAFHGIVNNGRRWLPYETVIIVSRSCYHENTWTIVVVVVVFAATAAPPMNDQLNITHARTKRADIDTSTPPVT